MKKELFSFVLGALVVAFSSEAQSQNAKKLPRIGYLSLSAGTSDRDEVFKQALRDLGWTEGQNVLLEYRWMAGKTERLPAAVEELIRAKVDVIFSTSAPATDAVKKATTTIPIVMPAVADPFETGFAASLARPGGNVTGISSMSRELEGKRLELLQEILPRLARVTYLTSSRTSYVKESQESVEQLGLKVQRVRIARVEEIEGAFSAIIRDRPDALSIAPILVSSLGQGRRIAEFALKNRLPTISDAKEFVDAGGLLSYGSDRLALWRRSAWYVDKILKGAKPADLPVEQPTKFELVINLKTAKQIGLTIPPNVLARADRVIK
jgi:putative tryptophan/tyrosine transport system substrate-binding protein